MAHHKSALKRIRQTDTRTERNRARRSRIRTFVKKVELAVTEGDQAKANDALRVAQSELARGVVKGVYNKNTASRKISRLNARVKALSA
ncbi:MAG: 30S ribosomal protein S20 [Sneathiella sp.]|uniref:30S ribosomal protein S20 n=1 Tax=Sneathiella sp. TaxID=1964365 RepID=UPI000C3D0662|nr:30S ribosomal protein S20 [Sneathiella sp.]MAZ03116.1 30S ribosomal protein S20 [Sneathiella sp.]